jgi:hypothetical protein
MNTNRKKKMKTSVINFAITAGFILTAGLFTSCMEEGLGEQKTNNEEIEVTLLFEKDGCKVYRFIDGGKSVYWTDCRGKVEYATKGYKGGGVKRTQNETVE